jgi:hypothetical protein
MEAAMRCEHCHRIRMKRSSRTILDESGSLAVTLWRCPRCEGVIEELCVVARDARAQPHRIRYDRITS